MAYTTKDERASAGMRDAQELAEQVRKMTPDQKKAVIAVLRKLKASQAYGYRHVVRPLIGNGGLLDELT